jgi:phosphoribosylformylglycinamidine synthase subunit PurS
VDIIEVCSKKKVPDVFGQEVRRSIEETGISKIKDVLTSELYCFEGVLKRRELVRIAEDILVDPISQEFLLNNEGAGRRAGVYRIVDIFYKNGVTDTVAETIMVALKDAGMTSVVSAATGRRYYLKGNLSDSEVKSICINVLMNPSIQDYSVLKGKDV